MKDLYYILFKEDQFYVVHVYDDVVMMQVFILISGYITQVEQFNLLVTID